MLFVTVGTHEQQFDRLIQEVDELKGKNIIKDEVIMQTGFSNYTPRFCQWSKFFSYEDMDANIRQADIIITHGGPASFIAALQIGKVPIVVPRQKRFYEHMNDHQLEFCKVVESRMGNIIVVEDIATLETTILQYKQLCKKRKDIVQSNNLLFNQKLEIVVRELIQKCK